MAELDDLELLREEHRELAHPLLGVALFEDRLTVGGFEPHRTRDEIRQQVRIRDVVDFHLHLARRLRQIADQLREERGEVAMHRDEFARFARDVRQFRVRRCEIRRRLRERVDLEDARAADDAADRAVRHLDHALDRADRADAPNVVRTRIFRVLILERDEADLAAVAEGFLDERDARLLDDRERDHGIGEQHGVLQRQDAEDVAFLFARGGH